MKKDGGFLQQHFCEEKSCPGFPAGFFMQDLFLVCSCLSLSQTRQCYSVSVFIEQKNAVKLNEKKCISPLCDLRI